MTTVQLGSGLRPETKLYRYISLESFMSLVEKQALTLTRVNWWDDTWEAVLAKVPTLGNDGTLETRLYSYHERLYGQCWSLTPESDALWRIYSPSRTGIRISTSVHKFNLIQGTHRGYLGKVIYFGSKQDLLKKAKGVVGSNMWAEVLFKRRAFAHEREVRFLTHGDFLREYQSNPTHVNVPIDPVAFLEGITLDPRADDWYVDVIASYCSRAGLEAKPVKSSLYGADPHLTLGIVKTYVPVGTK